MTVSSDITPEFLPQGVQAVQLSTATFVAFCMFILEMQLHLSARVPGLGVLRPTLLLVLVIFGLLMSQSRILKQRAKSPIGDALKYLIIYLLITLPLVSYPGSVLRGNWQVFLKAIVFFYFTASIVDSPKRLRIFLILYVGCQVYRVLEPLYMNITQGYWGSSTYMGGDEFADRLAGSPWDVINANELGFLIAGLVPFLHFLLLPRGWKLKCLYLVLMGCLLYALMLTMSRGAFLALMVIGWMVWKRSNYKAVLIIVGVGCVAIAWSIMNPAQKDRYLSLFSDETKASGSRDGRFRGMAHEFELGMQRPIVGHGLGTTNETKFHVYGKSQASHNMYAELVIEIGLVGMFLFLRLIIAIYREVRKVSRLVGEHAIEIERMQLVIVSLFWMYAVYSINYWGLSQNYWYLLAGLSVAFLRIVEMQKGNDLYSPFEDEDKK